MNRKIHESILCSRAGRSTVAVVIGVVCVLVLAAGLGALIGYYTSGSFLNIHVSEMLQPPFDGKQTVRILVLGEDNTGRRNNKDARGLTDTIILVSVNLSTKYVAALSVPRDTRVDLDGYGGIQKINAAHVNGGPALTRIAVEGVTGIRPDYYIKTNTDGFKKCVDILGGVVIDVEKNMHYDDNWGNLHIHLKKGRQLLDGEKAMGYVRFRHDAMGDITRIERQQKFLKALAKKALAPENLPKLPLVVKELLKNVETDMSPRDVVYLARFASRINVDEVKTATLPGVPQNIGGISYWIADTEQTAQLVQDLFFPKPPMPTVQVLNGSGVAGAAQSAAAILESQGYKITMVGNADSFDYPYSQVIRHKSTVTDVDRIAGLVNCSTVKEQFDASAKADVTVIVGKDFSVSPAGS